MTETDKGTQLEGKVAVITGAGSGIGRATALLFLDQGAQVVAADKNPETLQATADIATQQGTGTALATLQGDVTDEAHIQALMQRAADEFGGLHAVFNNAGAGGVFGDLDKLDGEMWDRTFQILVKSVFLGMKHALAHMTGGGSIINTASVASMTGGGAPLCYSACKAAVRHMSRVAAQELGARGIRVNSVSPGLINTPLIPSETATVAERVEFMRQPLQQIGSPEDIARGVLWLASDASGFVTGTNLVIDGGATAQGLHLFDLDAERGSPLAQMAGMTFGNTGEEPIAFG